VPSVPWRLGTIVRASRPVTVVEIAGAIHPLAEAVAATGVRAPGAGLGVREILDHWDAWQPVLSGLARDGITTAAIPRARIEWLPAVPEPRKIVCVGINYRDHLFEKDSASLRLERPFAFVKPQNTLLGHERTLVLPPSAHKVDWEGELAVIIGRQAANVHRDDALGVVAGYCAFNDISARDWIDQPVAGVGMDWILHKSFDGFGPLGPLVTPAKFVRDPQDLAIRLTVNGEVKQSSTTAEMVFGVREIIEHLASVMTLMPGDVIATGSPSGVGHARGEYLADGDRIVLSIAGLGELETPVRRAPHDHSI
jgi:2-keto-4-pentenoate hydratase/2-oxohepta-3-ene-1,7-dioic acid hydratase in catechol pathway